jgi:cytochrome c oxidase cbb3-type subunit I/II
MSSSSSAPTGADARPKNLIVYDDQSVRWFMIASIVWGIVGMLAGALAASQLNFWQMNGKFLEWISFGLIQSEGLQYISFGRLRPLHTNAVIFAFVGNMMFAGVYYSTQRLCRCRTASDFLSKLHFFGWNLIIVAAAITLPAGLTRGKEYAELIWPINIAVALIWVVFAINFFWTLAKRNEPTLYVALWFYIATILTVAMLYIVNHLSIPTSLLHSYPLFGGVQDALVQWWYGHNAVAFFLTTPILGIMYYFMPKAAERPVYSYRLSVIHFWSLVFVYIWAGPHHLLNTALPAWLQFLGMLFSLMLWAPSWGGMLNGLLTLRGAWHKLRTDPVLKFLAAGVTFYGMATFEGPLLSIRSVNAVGHYSDWIIGHVHAGALGWNGLMAAGMFYWLAPRLWNTKLHSTKLADLHFWLAMTGILFYVGAMWTSGITQGLNLLATTDNGTTLAYPIFTETLKAIRPMMLFRLFGGLLYLSGFVLLAYNIFKTARSGEPVNGTTEVHPAEDHAGLSAMGAIRTFINAPILVCTFALFFGFLWLFGNDFARVAAVFGLITTIVIGYAHFLAKGAKWGEWYDQLLANAIPFSILTFAAAAIGGVTQILPTVLAYRPENVEDRIQVPYTPLELAGRDIYIREGCYNCHSQMIRTLVPDVLRYGDYSRLGESIYDHPFQWGSRRTGPDLAREGGKYNNAWHYDHMLDPRSMNKDSNMPSFPWLAEQDTDIAALPAKLRVQRLVGVPYPEMTEAEIDARCEQQAKAIALDLRNSGKLVAPEKELVAVIAYLQKLGKSQAVGETTATAKN